MSESLRLLLVKKRTREPKTFYAHFRFNRLNINIMKQKLTAELTQIVSDSVCRFCYLIST